MKKIRKNYSGVVPNGKVLNSRNNSLQDTYSSDYLNRAIPDTKDLGPIIVDSVECKNLFNKNSFIKIMSYLDTTTGLITENVHNHTLFIKCLPNTTYTIQKMLSGVFAVGYINEEPAIGVKAYSIKNDNNLASITITTGSEAKYLAVRYYHNTVDTQYTEQQVLDSIQVEKGSVATNYVPHKEFDNEKRHITEGSAKLEVVTSAVQYNSFIQEDNICDFNIEFKSANALPKNASTKILSGLPKPKHTIRFVAYSESNKGFRCHLGTDGAINSWYNAIDENGNVNIHITYLVDSTK